MSSADKNIPSIEDVFSELNLKRPGGPWAWCWEQTQRSMPESVPFLSASFITEVCDRIGLSTDQRGAFIEALRLFEEQPLWKRIAWHHHQILFGDTRQPPASIAYFPKPEGSGSGAAMYVGLIMLSGVPQLFEYHASRGIPEEVTIDTLSDLKVRLDASSKKGQIAVSSHYWMQMQLAGQLFKIGRLQFEMKNFGHGLRAFRNQKTKEVVLLAESEARFRSDGQFANAIGASETLEEWDSELIEDETSIRGTYISPLGRAVQEPRVLEKSDWTCILRRGDPVLDLHIPAMGPMDFDACGESMKRASTFFPKHFPAHSFAAFTCSAWFLDTQLEAYLKPTSNLVRFMGEFYLHPMPLAHGRSMMIRALGRSYQDLSEAPQESSLQKAVVSHLQKGGSWFNGGLVSFTEDLDWGEQVYRCGVKS